MPAEKQVENAQAAFGYATTVNTPPFFHSQRIRRYRNLSTATGIAAGAVVVRAVNLTTLSTFYVSSAAGMAVGSTVDEGVFVTTRYGHPGVVGVTVTSCAIRSTGTTLGVGAPSSEYVDVCEEGPAWTLISTVTGAAGTTATVGNFLVNGTDTVSGGSTVNLAVGGVAAGLTSASLATAAVSSVLGDISNWLGILGQVIVGPTTGSTGQLTSQARGLVWVRPQAIPFGAVYGARISTA
jgi:hypothetical protein